MQDNYTTKNKHLTYQDRKLIYKWKNEGKSNREIARLLGKAPQTINNEIKRGTVLQQVKPHKFRKVYHPDYASKIYKDNRKKSVKKGILTKAIKDRIIHLNKQKISPEMMIKKYKVKACISSIYYWIHNDKLGKKVKLFYPHKRKKIKKVASTNYKAFGKSIDQRDDIINLRLEKGHFEIDTVILTRAKNECLLTLVDRRTRETIIRLIKDKTALSVNNAIKEIVKKYKVKSITADNGTEFARLSEVFSKDMIFYAHPYCSWERGSNENHNRLIRRWLPKGSKKTTQREVAFIEFWINNYPKKILNYMTPREFARCG